MGYEPSFISETDFKLSDYSPALGAGTSDGAPLKDIIGNDRPSLLEAHQILEHMKMH